MLRTRNPVAGHRGSGTALRLLAVAVIFGGWAASALAAEVPFPEAVRREVEALAQSGECDLSVVGSIQNLPRAERASLATRLAAAKHPAVRYHALLILREFPPQVAAESIRKLLEDESPATRNAAALYLAKEAKDLQARSLLLRNASSADPLPAASAVEALGSLGGPEVSEVLLKLLQDRGTPNVVRLAAIQAAGAARATECTPALVGLLDDRALREMHRGDTVRVCDLAASALEQIHQLNHIGPPGFYFSASVEKRDEGIALWKAWVAKGGGQAGSGSQEKYLDRLIGESLKTLQDSPDEEARKGVRTRVEAAFKVTFCLGELPGVDALVALSVRDIWKILRVTERGSWGTVLNSWHTLQLEFLAKTLPKEKGKASAPDRQALAFVLLAESVTAYPRVWVWALCRNFGEAFPKSGLAPRANEVKARLEAQFRKERMQVVLHGHTPVLEPLARPTTAPARGVVAEAYTALWNSLSQEPSNWALHRSVIEYYRRASIHMADYPPFPQQSQLYRGNEYPYLGNAAYQLRVQNNPKLAIEFANKALILNPGNAKAHAIRGMIRVVSGDSLDAGLVDLMHAFELDPASLGDEPETLQAAVFLVEKTLASGDKVTARTYLKSLGELRAFNAQQPLKTADEFRALLQRASAP